MSAELLRGRWVGMVARCADKKNRNYGGRGISVCDEWRNSFDAFAQWAVSSGFSPELQIDRINNDGNYEPGNCRWVTKKVNMNNRKSAVPRAKNCTTITVLFSKKDFKRIRKAAEAAEGSTSWVVRWCTSRAIAQFEADWCTRYTPLSSNKPLNHQTT